jgi:prepilin-type N-terminal cleavage/methylation domain-containing protein
MSYISHMKRQPPTAFTLIELLVVITIIAILASFALPAYTAVQERAQQTKDLSNAKQIALALKQFAADNNGAFPAKAAAAGEYTAAAANAPTDSNSAFFWLFPNYLQSEDIFVVNGSKWTPANPDNKIDAAGAAPTDTLKSGENSYAYLLNLTDTANAAFPLVADGFADPIASPPVYDTSKTNKGGVWAAKKAIVAFCDGSGQILKCDATKKYPTRLNGAKSLFEPDTGWLDAANTVLNPK